MSNEQRDLWAKKTHDLEVTHCGRLDLSTSMPDEVSLGRVTSDRVRYVYFGDGSECIVLGKFCDHVAFRAWEYQRLLARVNELSALCEDAHAVIDDLLPGAQHIALKDVAKVNETMVSLSKIVVDRRK